MSLLRPLHLERAQLFFPASYAIKSLCLLLYFVRINYK